MSLITQEGLTLAGTTVALLCFKTTMKIANSSKEQANTTFGPCWLCGKKDNMQCNCPHQEATQQFVTKRRNGGNGSNGNGNGGWGKSQKGKGGVITSNTNAANTNVTNMSNTSTGKTNETAGVATLLSNESCITDIWLCDSGASSSMSRDHSAFKSLTTDWCLICLADGKVIYSCGLGTIEFLSSLGYIISIDNVLFVPSLSVNLFSTNKFAKEHCNTHSETMEYAKQKWINWHTSTVEFTAMIQANDLVYLDWRVAPWAESTNVSMEELHTCLNHPPFQAVWHLMQSGSVNGVSKQVTGTWHPNEVQTSVVSDELLTIQTILWEDALSGPPPTLWVPGICASTERSAWGAPPACSTVPVYWLPY